VTRHSEDDYFSLARLNKQLLDSIEQSKELMRRSQQLLDRHRSGEEREVDEEENDGGQAA
jgi:hypothetical protein